MNKTYNWGTGRRKSSIARVRVRPGEGKFTVNEREIGDYFPRYVWRFRAIQPLDITGLTNKVDVFVSTFGGGLTGQADSIRLGIARALLKLNPELRPILKKAGMLTRDSRQKERKKFGLKSARAAHQYSKR